MNRRCKDCSPGSKRPAPHPGPRCATHHRAKKKVDKKRAHEHRVQKTYGLRPGEYDEMYTAQGGRCALCRVATGKTRRLAVDHDHKTGAVRGLLCKSCNRLLGYGRDDSVFFRRCAEYLEDRPTGYGVQ